MLTYDTISNRLQRFFAAIQPYAGLLAVLIFSILYFWGTSGQASIKRFWYDELFTVYLSRLPQVSDIWASLRQATDLNPPLIYLATRLANFLPGNEYITNRLPPMLGFWVMCLCLYKVASRYLPKSYAVMAMVMPTLTEAYFYAYEARPYGLVLGFTGLTWVCWQNAAAGTRRRLWLPGLALSLALAVNSHYYAILLVMPLFAGELIRGLDRRKPDLGIAVAIVIGAMSLLLNVDLIRSAAQYSSGFVSDSSLRNDLSGFFNVYQGLLGSLGGSFALFILTLALPVIRVISKPAETEKQFQFNQTTLAAFVMLAGPLLALVIAVGMLSTFSLRNYILVVLAITILILLIGVILTTYRPLISPTTSSIPLYEYAAAWTLVFVPIVAIVLAIFVTGAFYSRYIVYAVFGVSLAAAYTLARAEAGRRHAGVILVTILCIFAGATYWLGGRNLTDNPPREPMPRWFSERTRELPVAVSAPLQYLPLFYESPANFRPQLIYIVNGEASADFLGYDTPERALTALANWVPDMTVYSYDSFLAETHDFYTYEWQTSSWLIPQLLKDGAEVSIEWRDGGDTLYLVQIPP